MELVLVKKGKRICSSTKEFFDQTFIAVEISSRYHGATKLSTRKNWSTNSQITAELLRFFLLVDEFLKKEEPGPPQGSTFLTSRTFFQEDEQLQVSALANYLD